VQFKRMLMFCLDDWEGAGPPAPPWLRHWTIGSLNFDSKSTILSVEIGLIKIQKSECFRIL